MQSVAQHSADACDEWLQRSLLDVSTLSHFATPGLRSCDIVVDSEHLLGQTTATFNLP